MRAAQRRVASPPSAAGARTLLVERLRDRWPEIEEAALTRLYGVSPGPERPDPDYAEGLRTATSAALAYLLAGVQDGDPLSLRPPPTVLMQARIAARNRVGLDTVLRRCFAGHNVFGDFLMQELERCEQRVPALPKSLLRTQAVLLERLLTVVSEEYSREASSHVASTEQRRSQLIERLLAGEPLDATGLGYELTGQHLGVVAKGTGAAEVLRGLAQSLDRRLLALSREDNVIWAWLGGGSSVNLDEALRRASTALPEPACLALGEAGEGVAGWRLSHQQAVAALPIALRGPDPVVRYADVALLASIVKDDLLTVSLRKIYLEPLENERDGGETLRQTLCAYFETGRNVSSAAAVLGMSRQAVNSRLRGIEEVLKQPIGVCATELEAALRIHGYSSASSISRQST